MKNPATVLLMILSADRKLYGVLLRKVFFTLVYVKFRLNTFYMDLMILAAVHDKLKLPVSKKDGGYVGGKISEQKRIFQSFGCG